MSDQAHMDPHVVKVAARESERRDKQLAQIEHFRTVNLAAEKERHAARVAQIDANAKAAREEAHRTFEVMQEAAVNFVKTRNDRAVASQFGLEIAFLHPLREFGRAVSAAGGAKP